MKIYKFKDRSKLTKEKYEELVKAGVKFRSVLGTKLTSDLYELSIDMDGDAVIDSNGKTWVVDLREFRDVK